MIRYFEKAPQAEMPFDESANITVIFVLQADAERVDNQKGNSFEIRDSVFDVSIPCRSMTESIEMQGV
jgi:hypothetical protein